MSFQKGSIEKKGNGKYLLRYRVREVSHPSGWRKASELIEAPTDKAAGKERDRRMREINSRNETAQTNGTQAAVTVQQRILGHVLKE